MRFFTDTEWSDKDQEIMKEIKNNMTNNKLTKQQEEKLKNDWGTFVGTRNYEPRAFREDCNWWIEQINSILNTEQEEECKQDCVRRYLDQKDWCKDHHTINKVVPQPISKEVEEFIEKCKKTALKDWGIDEQEEELCEGLMAKDENKITFFLCKKCNREMLWEEKERVCKGKCGYECDYQSPYGFVPEAGCPIHDTPQSKEECNCEEISTKNVKKCCEICEPEKFPQPKEIEKETVRKWIKIPVKVIDKPQVMACDVCGGYLCAIRASSPQGDRRFCCPTCAIEILEQIENNLQEPNSSKQT